MRKQWIPGALLPDYQAPGNEATNQYEQLLQGKGWSPDLRGSLSSCLPSQANALWNMEVENVTSDKGKQHGQYW